MTSTRSRCLRSLVAAVSLCAGGLQAQAPVTLGIDGRENATVRLASAGQFVAVAWGAVSPGGTDVYVATSRDGGVSFTAPVRVNDTPGDARVNGEQPPQVALVRRAGALPELVVVWMVRRPDGGRLVQARSRDGGATFTPAAIVPGTEAPGNRGWQSVTVTRDGRVLAMWLDHRDLAMPAHAHGAATGAATDPVERAGKSQLLVAGVDQRAAPVVVTRSVCYCCKTSLVTGADGAIYGTWRHVYPGDYRDMALTVSRDGGRTFSAPVRVSEDGWAFDGCPDNGPSVAVDNARRVHVAWPAPADPANASALSVFYASSGDARRFTPRVRLPTGPNAGHVQVVARADGSALVAWDETAPQGRTVRITSVPRGGGTAAPAAPVDLGVGKYPALTRVGDAVLVAWSQPGPGGSRIVVRALR